MRHALLVAPHAHDEISRILLKRLSDADHVAMAEDAEDALEHRILLAIEFNVLVVEELHECLCDCKANRLFHVLSSTQYRNRL